jgi:hypothetical protein
MSEKELNEDVEKVLWETKLFEEVLGNRAPQALILNEDGNPMKDFGNVIEKEIEERMEMNNRAVHKELVDRYLSPNSLNRCF